MGALLLGGGRVPVCLFGGLFGGPNAGPEEHPERERNAAFSLTTLGTHWPSALAASELPCREGRNQPGKGALATSGLLTPNYDTHCGTTSLS